jgi:hypothetical protein
VEQIPGVTPDVRNKILYIVYGVQSTVLTDEYLSVFLAQWFSSIAAYSTEYVANNSI